MIVSLEDIGSLLGSGSFSLLNTRDTIELSVLSSVRPFALRSHKNGPTISTMVDTLLDVLTVVLPATFGVLGAFVSINPLKPEQHKRWLGLFIMLGAMQRPK